MGEKTRANEMDSRLGPSFLSTLTRRVMLVVTIQRHYVAVLDMFYEDTRS